jgi:aromatic ring hydroxylase
LRALTKLEFAYGLATRMAEAVNDVSPHTLEMLGELSGYVEVTRSAVLLAEEHAYDRGEGVWFPDGRPLHPMRAILATWFPRVNDILITIGSHNLLATPSRAMLADARLRPLIDEFLHGSNDVDAEQRAALYRLAWDFVGSNLGARNDLYERNYLASARTNRTGAHMVYADHVRPSALVDAMLAAGRG